MGILTVENIGVVNAEGGPLLLADFRFAQSWHGAEGDSSDYQRACDALDSEPRLEGIEIPISEGRGVLWEMEGAGTADIFRMSENHIAIVRVWPEDPLDTRAAETLALQPTANLLELGTLVVATGVLAILWAAENGECLRLSDAVALRPSGETAIQDSVLILRVQKALFRCQHDKVETPSGIARRLHLFREP